MRSISFGFTGANNYVYALLWSYKISLICAIIIIWSCSITFPLVPSSCDSCHITAMKSRTLQWQDLLSVDWRRSWTFFWRLVHFEIYLLMNSIGNNNIKVKYDVNIASGSIFVTLYSWFRPTLSYSHSFAVYSLSFEVLIFMYSQLDFKIPWWSHRRSKRLLEGHCQGVRVRVWSRCLGFGELGFGSCLNDEITVVGHQNSGSYGGGLGFGSDTMLFQKKRSG